MVNHSCVDVWVIGDASETIRRGRQGGEAWWARGIRCGELRRQFAYGSETEVILSVRVWWTASYLVSISRYLSS